MLFLLELAPQPKTKEVGIAILASSSFSLHFFPMLLGVARHIAI